MIIRLVSHLQGWHEYFVSSLWHIKQGIQRFNTIVGHLYTLHPQKMLWSQSHLFQIRTKEDICLNRRHVSSDMLINYLLCVAPLLPPLAFSRDRGLAATGVRRKKSPRAFLDFSTHICVPRAWITGGNVKYDENSGKTCLMCPSIKTDCKKHKERSREEVGKKASGCIFLYLLVCAKVVQLCTAYHCHLTPRRSRIPLDLKSFCVS